ncbi:MAG: tetratricopeptide repeat protein, partial [Flavobacteriales bacterium]|nr:tetratricopeptide repeat protein [Flavobacteriales bacterium]
HRKAAELREGSDYFHGIAYSHQYMAMIHRKEERFDEAIAEYRIAAHFFQQVPTYSQVASTYGSIARIHMDLGDADAALATLGQALELLERFNEAVFAGNLYDLAGDIHDFRGDLVKAREAYEHAAHIAVESGSLDLQVVTARHLSRLFEKHGDARNAYLQQQRFLAARDSLRNRSGRSEVLRMMLEHDAEQAKVEKEKHDEARRMEQQEELQSRQRQQRFYMAGGGVLLVFAIGLVGRIRHSQRSRRELERQRNDLQRAKQRAEQSEKFKERFLANMSHEIRTPMNAIMGMTTIMRRNAHLPHQEVYLNAIALSSENLLHIINDILDLSKLDADRLELERTAMDPMEVVRSILDDLGPRARSKGLELRSRIVEGLPRSVLGDPTRLRQLLMNLAENAVKYTREGHVDISVTTGPITGNGMSLVFAISDTGPGIPPERMGSIFEEFNK